VTPVLGVDIGGSGIKAALVDVERGALVGDRVRVETPQPAAPEAVLRATADLVAGMGEGPVGVGFPAAILRGRVMTASNIDQRWIGLQADHLLTEALRRPVSVLNDADAAGLAEVRFGAGRDVPGVVLMLTLGTGIGSALFLDGRLVPNTELGHLEIRGKDAERRAASSVRTERHLSWARWARRLNEVLDRIDLLFWPDLVILGGGVSRRADRFLPLIATRPRVVAARLQNEAGIVGAALRAAEAPPHRATPSPLPQE
jgi:polyphosphate glucokinase